MCVCVCVMVVTRGPIAKGHHDLLLIDLSACRYVQAYYLVLAIFTDAHTLILLCTVTVYNNSALTSVVDPGCAKECECDAEYGRCGYCCAGTIGECKKTRVLVCPSTPDTAKLQEVYCQEPRDFRPLVVQVHSLHAIDQRSTMHAALIGLRHKRPARA